MATHNKMTETKYNAIKLILQGGASTAEAAKYMQVSDATVYRIKSSETFEEYTQMMAAQTLAWKKKRAAIKAKEKAAAEHAAAEHAAKAAENRRTIPAEFLPQPAPQITPAVPQEVKHTVQVQATRFMEEQMRKQTELLTIICNKLGVIIDDLYGTKEG